MSAPSPVEPVAWRHSDTHDLHDFEHEVQLADADSRAEPLYDAAALAAARRQALEDAARIVEWHKCGSPYPLRDELAAAIRALMEKP